MTSAEPRILPKASALKGAFACIALLGVAALLPRAANPAIRFSLLGVTGLFSLWLIALARSGRALEAIVRIRRPHWVQAIAHSSIFIYWGAYVDAVYPQLWLIGAQVVFAYGLDLLMAWTRGRQWVIGFGPFPIVGSTNLFLWFRDDLFYLQLIMIALCFLSREFLRWHREGRSVHIFNPSGFGLTIASIALIATGTTEWTWGSLIATTLIEAPYMYAWIFGAGVVVQVLFGVGLVTMCAAITTYAFGYLWFSQTGDWYFENTHIPVAVFLGMHLLITDPVTSPRSNGGKVLFGSLYGLAVFPLYSWLLGINTPSFYDKLMQVPVLNALVPLLDKVGKHIRVPKWSLAPRPTNLIHVGLWATAFLLMRGDLKDHPGQSPFYWEKRCSPQDKRACENLATLYQGNCKKGMGLACGLMADMFMQGDRIPQNEQQAVYFYEQGCNHKDMRSCGMTAVAYEEGRGGLKPSPKNAMKVRMQICQLGDGKACVEQAARFMDGRGVPKDVARAVAIVTEGCSRNLPEPCGVLAFMHHRGQGMAPDPAKAKRMYQKACRLGLEPACAQEKALP
jgi:hypothetical protein